MLHELQAARERGQIVTFNPLRERGWSVSSTRSRRARC